MEVRLYSEMFITAVSVLFLIKLRWPKNKNLYDSETRLAALLVQNQSSRPGETPHMKGVGMLVGNFELNPKRRPIWAWPKLFLIPERDHVETNEKTWIV